MMVVAVWCSPLTSDIDCLYRSHLIIFIAYLKKNFFFFVQEILFIHSRMKEEENPSNPHCSFSFIHSLRKKWLLAKFIFFFFFSFTFNNLFSMNELKPERKNVAVELMNLRIEKDFDCGFFILQQTKKKRLVEQTH